MRCFLVGKTLREKCSNTLGRMQYGVTNMNKRTREGGVALKQIKLRRDDLKVLAKEGVAQTHVQQEKVGGLKKSLEESHRALESMEEWVSQLKNDVVVAFVYHFEEAKNRISILYPHLDLSPPDPFKVILDGELVDEE